MQDSVLPDSVLPDSVLPDSVLPDSRVCSTLVETVNVQADKTIRLILVLPQYDQVSPGSDSHKFIGISRDLPWFFNRGLPVV